MSDTPLETICITGSRPPFKKPAWVIGQVGDETSRSRVQTAPGRTRNEDERSPRYARPKSTPSRQLDVSLNNAAARCFRFSQVHSAKRRKSLEGEAPMSTVVLSPGYVLSRSKEKINVTIKTDDFFTENQSSRHRKKTKPPDEKDIKISQLQQQINDLIMFLEEERLNHKSNIRKTAENHHRHIEKIHEEHHEHIGSIEQDHEDEINKMKESFDRRLEEECSRAEADKVQLRTEMEFLQGAFESYKETVASEMDYKWQRRENELKHEHKMSTEEALGQQRKELIHEKNKELDGLNKEHQRQIETIVEQHGKEIDRLMEKFAECVQDSENLKKVLTEMQVMTKENASLKEKLKSTSDKLRKTTVELEDKKVKLAGYEEHFAEKVAEVDNKYSNRIHGLMSDNTDLRRHYVKKCEEVIRLQSHRDIQEGESLRSAKDTMQAVIKARTRSNVSLTVLRVSGQHSQPQHSTSRVTKRRSSLPITEQEIAIAVQDTSAISTETTQTSDVDFSRPSANHMRPHTSQHIRHATTPRHAARESFLPTPVNISEQGLQRLKIDNG
ncbi:repetitive organellar protein isoform X2 [Nematostella vectensis]|uniref:repetitive organellar protein isoform X2 n=1 Tax=Nematostella vectensis TaxID=45351 RepID=UPI0020776EDE|nr:repetitive organellar protein isoform X2 [Nematostella vectensis]